MEKAIAKRSMSHNHATNKRKMKTPKTKTFVCVREEITENHTHDFISALVVI